MKPINTHEDLLNTWYNVENPEFNVYDDRKPNIVIEVKGILYNIVYALDQYVIQEMVDYKFHTLKIGQRPPAMKYKNLKTVDTPQAVYDYFKPFMEDRNNER